jgi:predicted nucleic acid-binding protein
MADESIVVNASPIIALAKIARLDLLMMDDRNLILPEAVAGEILEGPPNDPARKALLSGWGGKPVAVVPDPRVLEWGLGAGETAVLSLAKYREAVAVVDDRAARVACKVLGIRLIGTLGIILRACKRGRLSSSVEALRALRQVGFHLDDDVIIKALKRTTGETWPS